jgi:acetyltransferase-like isoleucine patch superfamily enzyme
MSENEETISNKEENEDEYIIDFITSSAISRVNLKFLIVYIPIIWISGIMTLLYFWTFFDTNLLIYFYGKQTYDLVIFFCLLPAHVFAMFTIFTFGCLIMSKLILVIVNLIHRPKEGIFRAELGDNDFEFWCLRIEIKKLVIWLMNNWPLPWADIFAFRWFGIKIDSSSHLLDAWCDIEFVEFGRRVMVGQGAVIMSSMVVGKYLIIKKVILDDHTVIGGESTIAPGTIVGKESVTGAVTCTLFNQMIEPRWVYAGIPARKLKPNEYAIERRDIISKKHVDRDKEKLVKHEVNIEEEKKEKLTVKNDEDQNDEK